MPDLADQGARRTALMEELSREGFNNRRTDTQEKEDRLIQEKRIPEGHCVYCERPVDPPGRRVLGYRSCITCAEDANKRQKG